MDINAVNMAVQKIRREIKDPTSGIGGQLSATYAARGLPAWTAGLTLTHTWDSTLSLYNGESPSLRDFRKKLAVARKGGAMQIVCIGDSKTAGAGIQAGSLAELTSYPGQLADLLGGTDGLLYANNAYEDWTASTGWTSAGQNSLHISATAGTPATITLDVNRPCTGFDFYYYAGSAGTLTVKVDSAAAQEYPLTIGSPWKRLSLTGYANTVHTLVISTNSAVSLLGVGPAHTGPVLSITNGGRSSSDPNDWLSTSWLHVFQSTVNTVTIPRPDAIIMGIGTNAGTSTDDSVSQIAANAKALGVPVLLLAPGGLSAAYDYRRRRVYLAAENNDLPLLDFAAIIGMDSAATAAGLMADTLHENGRGYALEAAAVARVLAL